MIFINNESNNPLYMQIYEQIKEQIITGQIPGGTKLPSIRGLSVTLNVSRNTVESAYMQLSSEGYIESKPGSGFISLKLDSMELLKEGNRHCKSEEPIKTILNEEDVSHYKYNFRDRCLSAQEFPLDIWRKLSNQTLPHISTKNLTTYNAKWGERDLQIELMKYLKKSRGVSCSPEQIIISSGSEYSLSLLCQLFRRDFDNIAIEDPGYMAARDIFYNNGYNVTPISLEKDGISIEELNNSSAKAVYVTPSHQFPTGSVLPIKKRIQLLEWAKRNGGIIIEDDYDSEFRYNSRPIPSLQSIDSIGSVIYIGTFSKSLSPSVRIGYMVLPKSLLEKYNKLFKYYHVTVSIIQQRILQQFMHLGYWDRHLRKIHTSSIRKHELLIHTIKEYMGKEVIIHGKNSGLHILLEFKNGLSEKEIVDKAKNNGILVSPVSPFWIREDKYTNNMIMIGFGGMPEGEIVEGIKALKNAIFH